jgi:hypothetical protein
VHHLEQLTAADKLLNQKKQLLDDNYLWSRAESNRKHALGEFLTAYQRQPHFKNRPNTHQGGSLTHQN